MAFLIKKLEFHRSVTIALLAMLLVTGCAKDEAINTTTSLRFSVNTKIQDAEQFSNTTISCTRLMIIDKSTESVIFNKSTDDGLIETVSGSQTYSLELEPGEYTTYIVANETETMKSALSGAAKLTDLKAIAISERFDETNIPLMGSQDFSFRKSQGDDGIFSSEVSIDGGTNWQHNLEILLKRIQCKVSLYLRKKTGSTDEIKITKVELCDIPDQSYLISKAYEAASPQSKVVFDNPSGINIGSDVADGDQELSNYTAIFDVGVIFPEKIMSDNTDASKSTYLKIHATCGMLRPTYIIKLRNDLSVENYDLTRNIHYKVYATVIQAGNDIAAAFELAPWKDGGTVDVEEGKLYYLNLSDAFVTYPHKLYFDKDKKAWLKDAAGNYIALVEFDYYCYFWANRASSTVKITDFQLDGEPNVPTGITNSMTILRDSPGGDSPDVMGKVDVSIPAEDVVKGLNKSYSMRLKNDKIDRKLTFAVTDYDIIPEVIPPSTALTDLVITGYGTSSAKSSTETFEFEAYLPIGSKIYAFASVSKVAFTPTEITPAGGDVFSPRKFKVVYTSDSPRNVTLGTCTVQFGFRYSDSSPVFYTSPVALPLTIRKP